MPTLPRQPSISVLDWNGNSALDAAVGAFRGTDAERARAALKRVRSALPPVCSAPDIFELAHGVLAGSQAAITQFQGMLDYFDSWSASRYPARPAHRSGAEARRLIEKWSKARPRETHDGHEAGLVRSDAIVILTAAAALAGARDPASLLRNVDVIHEQLGMIDLLAPLVRNARLALAGQPGAESRLLHALLTLGADSWTTFRGVLPPFPGGPVPFPWPSPEPPPGLPLPPGFPWELPEVGEDFPPLCSAVAVHGILKALEGESWYRIDSIEPQRACPGETITLTGKGFDQTGYRDVQVVFPSAQPSPIAVPPLSRTDTTITVVVPSGAVSGDLRLDIDAALVLERCGARLEFSPVAKALAPFHGGVTSILSFGAVDRKGEGECLHAGEVVSFGWSVSNGDGIRLTFGVEGHCGAEGPVSVVLPSSARSYDYTLPSLECHSVLSATLSVDGPCGRDQKSLRIGVQGPAVAAPPFPQRPFVNWHNELGLHLCDRPAIDRQVRTARPADLPALVSAVASIGPEEELGIKGSGWSYTDCVIPAGVGQLINTSRLQRVLDLPPLIPDPVSVLSPRVRDRLNCPLVVKRLLHVQAGIKIHRLNCELECRGLAMPTLGGSFGQSLGGVMGTGTHGANPDMPPIADLVRALHLVGPGGQQWWIEPSDAPITNEDSMKAAKEMGQFDPCLRLVYDNDLFRACLVAFGSAGVLYSAVLEAVPAHCLKSTTVIHTWDDAQVLARTRVIDPPEPSPWFFELSVNPTRRCWVTTREPTNDPISPEEQDHGPMPEVLALLFGPGAVGTIVGLGTGAVAALLGALPFYILRRSLLYAWYVATFQWGKLRELQDEIELLYRLAGLVRSIVEVVATGGDDAAVARMLPQLLNVMWQVGLYVVDGRVLIDQIQDIFTSLSSRPPGTRVQKSFRAMTTQPECEGQGHGDCKSTTYPDPPPDPRFTRLAHSQEFVLPADRCLAFANAVLDASDRVRRTNDAFMLVVNVRFTRGTQALLGMQQGTRVGHVELYTFDGMAGNAALHPLIDVAALSHGAIPHWGQFHSMATDFTTLYPELPRWRSALDRIASEGGARANTFRHSFARDRRLLSRL